MKNIKRKEKEPLNIEDIENTFRLKGAITPKRELQGADAIFEQLGFTTSINSIVKDLEQDGQVQVLSPYSHARNLDTATTPTNFGAISNQTLEQMQLDPSVKRIKFINNTLLRLLLLAIIVNFILIFVF